MNLSTGTSMTVYGVRAPGAGRITRWAARAEGLTVEAHRRVRVLDWHEAHERNVSRTARHFGLTRTTVRQWGARLVQAGLDPRLGFVHTDGEDGTKLSLLYDFVEEFRAIGADRPVLALVVRGLVVWRLKDGRLALPTRRKLLHAFARNLEARCRQRTERRPLADIIDAQARHLAEVLAEKRPKTYRAFRYNH
jgi:hypothetical protein